MYPRTSKLLISWLIGIIVIASLIVLTSAWRAGASDNLVFAIEHRLSNETGQRVTPGSQAVIPECNCSVRYLGTVVSGRNYYVHIRRMD